MAALVAVISATGQTRAGRRLCAQLLDAAVAGLEEPNGMAASLGAEPHRAVAVIGDICAACRACPRGWLVAQAPAKCGGEPETVER